MVPPWHSECSGDPPAMAEWTLQGRGTWAGGQHCLLKPDPGRNPCCDPWPGSSGTTHHPLPRTTDWQHHPAPLSPPSPTECSAISRMGQVENWPQATPPRRLRVHEDGLSQFHPTASTVHASPRCGVPHGAPPCVQARLAFGEAPFGGTLGSPSTRGGAKQGGTSARAAPTGTGRPRQPPAVVGF